ncbi:hypothetical protein [Pseudarthrobacter phenanthrenivorans]|uniref:hypothetical protein n=1 Tax=Pseudarthrobacter phenanthrenivorans TaxID=361575 RepID=UPI0012DFFFAE|nr:hypothetical protein [Pseudarthrobacter phenanthrenivorans]
MDLHQITDGMSGCFAVRTSSGTLYSIDLDSTPRKIVRLAEDRPPTEDYADLSVSKLRKDGTEIPLLAIGRLTVGEPAQLVLDVRGDGVVTVRETTPVLSIRQLSGDA